jgi:transposase
LQRKFPTNAKRLLKAPDPNNILVAGKKNGYKEEWRLLTMTEVHNLRKLYFEEGKSITEISKETGRDRKTVRMYLGKEDWNEVRPGSLAEVEFPKLDSFKVDIDAWLTEDKKAKRKQRHTARRVYQRLVDKYQEGFTCSYRTVAGYVSKSKK